MKYIFKNEKINEKTMRILTYYSPYSLEENLAHAYKSISEIKQGNLERNKSYAINRLQTAFNIIENVKTKTKRIKQSKEDFENLLKLFETVFEEKLNIKETSNYRSFV